jgi:hypothetical protein
MGHGEHPATSWTKHPCDFGEHGVHIGDKGQRAEGRAGEVEGRAREGHLRSGGTDRRHRGAGRLVQAAGVLQLSVRQVEPDRVGILVRQPPRALRGAAADLEHSPPGHVPQQSSVCLVQALR